LIGGIDILPGYRRDITAKRNQVNTWFLFSCYRFLFPAAVIPPLVEDNHVLPVFQWGRLVEDMGKVGRRSVDMAIPGYLSGQ
jgi:hypothetical protein